MGYTANANRQSVLATSLVRFTPTCLVTTYHFPRAIAYLNLQKAAVFVACFSFGRIKGLPAVLPRRKWPPENLLELKQMRASPIAKPAIFARALDSRGWQTDSQPESAYLKKGQRESAIKHFRQAVEIQPNSTEAQAMLRRAEAK